MSIGKEGMNQDRDPISEWRVYLPIDQDRARYVKSCFMSGTVSLISESGEFKHRVEVDSSILPRLVFPQDNKTLGSKVVCLSAPYSGKLYVVGVFNSSTEYHDQDEQQYRLFKTAGGTAEVKVDGSGKISLSVDSETDDSEVAILITSKNKLGRLKIVVNGDAQVDVSGDVNVNGDNINVKALTGVTVETRSGGLIMLDDAGLNIDSGDRNVFINGNGQVLFAKTPGATEILDVSEIAISQKTFVG